MTIRLLDLFEHPQPNNILLHHFYYHIITPAFPSPDELDPIEVWEEGLDRTRDNIHSLDPDLHVVIVFNESNEQIGGCVWELYPSPRPNQPGCGLLSYIVSTPQSRGRGIAKLLVTDMVKSLQSHGCTLLVAEMHKLGISDGTDMDPTERHYAFQRMGFAPLYFPYIQPPLTVDLIDVETNDDDDDEDDDKGSAAAGISTDLLLLAHCDMLTSTHCVPSIDLLEYLDGFCGTVFGFEERKKWTNLLWYQSMVQHLETTPFICCLDQLPAPWREDETVPVSPGLIVVVGSGLISMSCALTLRRARRKVVLLLIEEEGEEKEEPAAHREFARKHVLAELMRLGVEVQVGINIVGFKVVQDGYQYVVVQSESKHRTKNKSLVAMKAETMVVGNVASRSGWSAAAAAAALRVRSDRSSSRDVKIVHFAGGGGGGGTVVPQMQVVHGMRAAAEVLELSIESKEEKESQSTKSKL